MEAPAPGRRPLSARFGLGALVLGACLVLQVAPATAQSGGRIIFYEGFNDRDSSFNGHRVMSGDGSTVRDLPEVPLRQFGNFALNRDGSRVAFLEREGLFAGNARFGDRVLLDPVITFGHDEFVLHAPDWSPSSQLIAVQGPGPNWDPPTDEQQGISVVPSGGGSPMYVARSDFMSDPSWAPDERRIVAVQQGNNVDPISRLIVLDRIAGTATVLVEEQPNVQIYKPEWSPDGSQIVYEHRPLSDPAGTALWRVGADGSGARQLVAGAGAKWSPDGRALAFVRFTGASAVDIYTIGSDGSGVRRLRGRRGTGAIIAGWVSGDLTPLRPGLGKSAVAEVARGVVLLRRPGSSRFTELVGEGTIPVGSLVDARRGAVRLTTASNRRGGTQSGTFNGGVFKLLQTRSARPVAELRLTGKLERCARRSGAAARVRGRQLQGNAKGSFRIRGRRSAATVTGANWLVADRCDGSTLTRVRSGRAAVRDFARRRNVVVRAGRRYVAG
jgi:hypothetical protein